MPYVNNINIRRQSSALFAFCQPFPFIRSQRPFPLTLCRPLLYSRHYLTTAILKEESPSKIKSVIPENPPSPTLPPSPQLSSLGPLDTFPPQAQNGLLLSLVPFLWGSYGVAAKYLFDTPTPMPLSLLNLTAFSFALLSFLFVRRIQISQSVPDYDTYRAGLELGTYLYIGTWLNLEAIERTSASRAAFLVQLTTVVVPLAEWALGKKVEPQVFAACGVAMAGAGVLAQSTDGSGGGMSHAVVGALNTGDLIAVAAAVMYSLHVLRLERLSKKTIGASALVQTKIITQVVWSAFAVALVMARGDTEVGSYVANFLEMPTAEMLSAVWWSFWIGAATTALATWAQVVGQERVGPSRAAIFYASQPLFAAGLACAFGIDKLTPQEILGGGLIVVAGVLLAVGDSSDKRKANDGNNSV